MNVIELTAKGTDKIIAEACGICRRVAHNKEAAEACCRPTPRFCTKCGVELDKQWAWTICSKCHQEQDDLKEKEKLEKAKKVKWSEYSGKCVYFNDHYFWDESEFLAHFEEADDEFDPPRYVWACQKQEMEIDAAEIVENALTDFHEDAWVDFDDEAVASLQKMINEWIEDNTPDSYMPDESLAVDMQEVIDERRGELLALEALEPK